MKNKLCCTFVSMSIKKEMNVFDSCFCSFVFPFTIAIFRGGEGGEENVAGEGVPRISYWSLPASTNFVLEYHDKKGKKDRPYE